jgi:hypothetical protein
MFFFRLHNLQREEANKKKKKIELRQRRGAKVFRRVSRADLSHLTAPSRLFEKTPMNPSDSLDEIALQIPRFGSRVFNVDVLGSTSVKLLELLADDANQSPYFEWVSSLDLALRLLSYVKSERHYQNIEDLASGLFKRLILIAE